MQNYNAKATNTRAEEATPIQTRGCDMTRAAPLFFVGLALAPDPVAEPVALAVAALESVGSCVYVADSPVAFLQELGSEVDVPLMKFTIAH
jgi:hypothetical protein